MTSTDDVIPRDGQPSTASGRLINEAVIIAATPFVGYLLTYVYDVGYLTVFNAPTEFISLGLSDILWWSLVFFATASVGWCFVAPFVIGAQPGAVQRLIFQYGGTPFMLVVVVVGALIFRHHLKVVIGLAAYAGVMLAVVILVPLLTQRDVRGFRAKFAAQREHDISTETLFDSMIQRVTFPLAFVILGLVFAGILSFALGTAAGLDQTTFSVNTKQPHLIELRAFSDRVIWARLDDRTHRIVSFTLEPISADHPVSVRHARLGHIKAAQA